MAGSTVCIRHATIVTQDAGRKVLSGDIFVEDGRITHVGTVRGRKEADHVIDATGQVLLPGLVNLHTHVGMTLLRGYADDMHLEPWLLNRIWPAEERIDEAAMSAGVELGLLEMVRGGTTSFLDMYWMEETVVAPLARKAGVRAWAGEGMIDRTTPEGEPNVKLAAVERFLRSHPPRPDDPHHLVTACAAPHATYTCNPTTLREAYRIATEYSVPMHTHLAETRSEVHALQAKTGRRPLASLEAAGALGQNSVLAHCGWITKAEASTIGRSGAAVAHCPVSNLKLATGGVCPVPELTAANATVGLGTDGAASNNSLSMFETMKFAALVQKQHRWDATTLPAQQALDMATRAGADALHRPDLGRIEVGATADLILVDFRRPHLVPRHDAVSHLVYSANAADVSTTLVAGRPLMAQGIVETLDTDSVLAAAGKQALRIRGNEGPTS